MSTRESSLTLDRGLALLQALADAGGEAATISELASRIGASRAAVYRLLVPLAERGLVWRDGSKVRLGVALLRLSAQVLPQLSQAAQPVLRELAEKAGATAHLSVADGEQVQAIAVVEPSWTSFHVAYRVGTRHAVTRGAAGRAITLRGGDPPWVSSVDELQSGASGVAAPLRGISGLRASVGVVSLEPIDADAVGPLLLESAAALVRALSPDQPNVTARP